MARGAWGFGAVYGRALRPRARATQGAVPSSFFPPQVVLVGSAGGLKGWGAQRGFNKIKNTFAAICFHPRPIN